jgi:hypothetical protein
MANGRPTEQKAEKTGAAQARRRRVRFAIDGAHLPLITARDRVRVRPGARSEPKPRVTDPDACRCS